MLNTMLGQGTIILYNDDREEAFSHPYVNTPHLASTLLDDGIYKDERSLEDSLSLATQVCLYLHIPVQEHFRHIYVRGGSGKSEDDWALSDFAYYLLLMNGKANYGDVAYAQACMLRRAFCK
jgi:hypothetical protein